MPNRLRMTILIIPPMLIVALAAPGQNTNHDRDLMSGGRAGFTLPWYTVDGGGGVSSAGGFTLHGTIGQPNTGTMSGGSFQADGGFWPAVIPLPCPADLNGSAAVDAADLALLLGGWGSCPGPCPPSCLPDLNGDCGVNAADLALLLGAWGSCP